MADNITWAFVASLGVTLVKQDEKGLDKPGQTG